MGIQDLLPWYCDSAIPIQRSQYCLWDGILNQLERMERQFLKALTGKVTFLETIVGLDLVIKENNFISNEFDASEILVRVSESDQEIKIMADLLNIESKDLKVALYPDRVVIQCLKAETNSNTKGTIEHKTDEMNFFRRDIPLAAKINFDEVKASYKDSMLRIIAPKTLHKPLLP